MKIGNILLTVTGLYGLYYLIEKMMFADKVKFEITNLRLDTDRILPNIVLTVKAINPTNTSATIKSFVGEAFINDFVKISDIRLYKEITIQPLANTDLTFSIIPDYKNIINYVKNIIENKKGYLTIKGMAVVEGLQIPVNLKYNVN